MTSDNVHALPLGTQLGDYRLDAVIGHGGFGITYRAFDGQLAKVVAIKEYLPIEYAVRSASGQVVARGARYADDFAWGRERFLEEARALARFRHPHIVPVLRFLEANGTAYTVMEFEDGRSVAQLLRGMAGESGRRLAPDEVRRLAEGLLDGLAAVHAQGFLHRDIKPSNIIVRRDGVPILIDFGAARQAMGGRTRTLTSVLTPQYAPIEQYAMDGRQGPWTDIYSAAAVLHHAIAGHPPPEATSRVGQDPYRPLAVTQADRYDQPFLGAIDRALAFAPEDRPQTVAAWRTLFGASLPSNSAPTQRIVSRDPVESAAPAVPRLGGARRSEEVAVAAPPPPAARSFPVRWLALVIVAALVAGGLWFVSSKKGQVETNTASTSSATPSPTPLPPPVAIGNGTPSSPTTPTPGTPSRAPVPQTSTPQASTPAAAEPDAANKDLLREAQRAAEEARAVYEKARDAAAAARTMAGEARITAARAAQSTLENAQRITLDDAGSYTGQFADGKKQGLGVRIGNDGERRGEWQNDQMNGRGTMRMPDGARYEGQWRDGQSTGLGVMEKPGVEREEGTFVAGKLEGAGLHRTLADPATVQFGEWHNDQLDGPGVETVGESERYEGLFRAGKRHGYGQLTTADKKVVSGRWEEGKRVEAGP
jgi:serine/threonine protein kinase